MSDQLQRAQFHLLMDAVEDDSALWFQFGIAGGFFPNAGRVMLEHIVLTLLYDLLLAGLVFVGVSAPNGGTSPWGPTPEDAIDRVATSLGQWEHRPDPEQDIWTVATPKGRAVFEELKLRYPESEWRAQ